MAHFHMCFNKEIAGKALTAKDDISISSVIRPVKSQEHQALFLHQKKALMAFVYALACYYAASMLCNSSRKDKAKLGETWPRSMWETAKN